MATPVLINAPSDTQTYTTPTRITGTWLTAARLLWLGIALLAGGLFIVGIAPHYPVTLQRIEVAPGIPERIGLTPDSVAAFNLALDILTGAVFFIIALLIFLRRSNERMAWIASLTLLTFGMTIPTDTYVDLAAARPAFALPVNLLSALSMVMLILFGYTVPDGHFAPRWAKWLWGGFAAWTLLYRLFPESALNPQGWSEAPRFASTFIVYTSALVVQYVRHRHYYTPMQKQQIKWIVFGFVAAIFGFVFAFLPEMIIPALREPRAAKLIYFIATQIVLVPTVCAIPVTVAFSAQRYRLWEIDHVINRSIVYAVVTVLLAIVFVGALLGSQFVLERLTGGPQATAALVAAAAVVGAGFQPVRRGIQRAVDRHVYGLRVEPETSAATTEPVPTPAPVRKMVGSYEVYDLIGTGSQGQIYRGQHPILGRPVAIKMLTEHHAVDGEFRQRFEREAKLVSALRHPNIIQLYDFGCSDNNYYMVMEYIDGRELKSVIAESAPMELDTVRTIVRDLAAALDYAHGLNIVHRDIKPSNVMLQRGTQAGASGAWERAVLMDFGIARMVGGTDGLTQTGVLGTLGYVAPEQIMQARHVDSRADIYALGVLTYEMVTSQLPFRADNPGQVLYLHLHQPPGNPVELRPDLPPNFSYAIMRALSKDPDDRFETAGQFVDVLND